MRGFGKANPCAQRVKGLDAGGDGRLFGTSRNHLSDLERGKREIGLLILQVIADGLDTTMAKLLKGL